jgi:hypothetical protein
MPNVVTEQGFPSHRGKRNVDAPLGACAVATATLTKGIIVQSRLAPRRRISNPAKNSFSGVFDPFSLG